MKFTLLVLCLFVAIKCSNTTPQRCCTAEQFQVSFGAVVGGVVDSSAVGGKEFFHGAFDFKGRQYGMDIYAHTYDGNPDFRYQLIQLFNKGEEYVIMEGVCNKGPLSQEPNRCVPDAANYTTSFYLGNQDLFVDDWSQSGDPAQGMEGDVHATTSRDDCTPGSVSFIGTVGSQGAKEQLIVAGSYVNFTKGIVDPDHWFVPPPSCNNATLLTDKSSWPPIQHWKRMQATQMFL